MAKHKVEQPRELNCSHCHTSLIDEDQSNENWVVYETICPECGRSTSEQVKHKILASVIN